MTPQFIPERTPKGGSLVGNSYISQAINCWQLWYNLYLRPITDDAGEPQVGVVPKFTKPDLLKGRVFHDGMAGLLVSGCRDGEDTGEWNIDIGMAAMELSYKTALPEYESIDQAEEDWQLLEHLLRSYHDWYGPGGLAPDYPSIKVAHDGNGQPLIEREFAVDLGYGGYIFTSRLDTIITHNGYLKGFEHKTSAPGFWVNQRRESIHSDAQFTGQLFVLCSLFPEEPIEGIMANIVVKGRGQKATYDLAVRETTRRSLPDLEHFRVATIDALQEIDRRVAGYNWDLDAGMEPGMAATRWFPDHGTRTGMCTNYRGCTFERFCRLKGRDHETIKHFRPRTAEETRKGKEYPK